MVKYCEFFSLLTHRERRMAIVANSTATPCTAVNQVPTIDIHLGMPPEGNASTHYIGDGVMG